MESWVEFRAIKEAVRLEQVLRHYQVQGLHRSGRARYRGCCPIHGGEGRDAFHVEVSKDVFHCFACGAGGTVLDLVAAMERCGLREAALKLAGWFVVPGQPTSGPPVSKKLVTEKSKVLSPLRFRLLPIDNGHPYLSGRGIEERTAVEFGVGLYEGPGLLSGRVVIPIHDEHVRLVAYCGRTLDGTEPRYKFPAGFPKSRVLFNFHRAAASPARGVVVVEGFFDCLKVHQAGFRSVVALMGSALSEDQRRLLTTRFRDVLLMLDGDQAGRRAAAMIADRLTPSCSVRLIELPADTQPDQLPAEEMRERLEVTRAEN